MSAQEQPQVTRLLQAWSEGDPTALEGVTAAVYEELRRIAHRYMRSERPGNTLETRALVNEVYCRLVDVKTVDWRHRAQFFAICAQMMRRILVDAARARGARKRDGGERVNLDDVAVVSTEPGESFLALHDALDALAKIAPRQARVVELRFFGGFSAEQIADVLETSSRTIERDWEFARAWLKREMGG